MTQNQNDSDCNFDIPDFDAVIDFDILSWWEIERSKIMITGYDFQYKYEWCFKCGRTSWRIGTIFVYHDRYEVRIRQTEISFKNGSM